MRRSRRAAITLAGASLMAGVMGAGCGSSTPVGALFPHAYAATINAKSAKITTAFDVRTAKGTLTSTGSGVADWGQRRTQVTQTVTTPGRAPVSVSEVSDGTDVYLQVPLAARPALGGKPWVRVSLAPYVGSQGGTEDPSQILSVLNAQSSSVTKLGSDEIGGVRTVHYRAQLDPTKVAPGAGPAARQMLAQLPALTGSSTLPVDVWIDGTGKARQLRYSLTLNHPPAGASPAAGQAFPETVTMTLGLSDYGVPVQVTLPPADQVSTQSLPGLPGS
jgi:hypothetical protein